MASMLYSHLPDVVGVVGAGQMGTGIAQVLAQRGLQVGVQMKRVRRSRKGHCAAGQQIAG